MVNNTALNSPMGFTLQLMFNVSVIGFPSSLTKVEFPFGKQKEIFVFFSIEANTLLQHLNTSTAPSTVLESHEALRDLA